ncbi:Low-expression lectin 3 [Operophtera brumata]|uniref:Low-expression lectin 3 n=1 Tax=Operophtera brumata TaxID=104452 RepID=A0A0L7LGJ1_OPEBR|nr:Low-expression lectin 3 [Operophtera brumata]
MMKNQCLELYIRLPVNYWGLYSSKSILAILIINAFTPITIANQRCSSETHEVPKYHLIEKCCRSKLGIAAKANLSSVISCQRLAIDKKVSR